MKTWCGLRAVLGLLLASTLLRSVPGVEPPKEGRALTAEERKEVARLGKEKNAQVFAGRFEEALKTSQQIVAYRAERQGRQHWEVTDARLEVERWQWLTRVAAKDRAEVVRGIKAGIEGR